MHIHIHIDIAASPVMLQLCTSTSNIHIHTSTQEQLQQLKFPAGKKESNKHSLKGSIRQWIFKQEGVTIKKKRHAKEHKRNTINGSEVSVPLF